MFSWRIEHCSCIYYKNKTIAIYLSVCILSYLLGSKCPEVQPFPYSSLSKQCLAQAKPLLNTINNLLKIVPVFQRLHLGEKKKHNSQAIKQLREKSVLKW